MLFYRSERSRSSGRWCAKGHASARVLRRALVLQQLDQGRTAAQVGLNLSLSSKAVRAIALRFEQEGLESALYEKPRPGKQRILNESQSQGIVAMVCGPAPVGQARWSVRLIATEAVRRKLVPQVGRETIRMLLESHDLKPWREKNVVRAQLDEAYLERLEDVLKVYERPLTAKQPVVCLDEKPVVLHADTRPSAPIGPGRVARRDYEYRRCGTANVFCAVDPKAGRHFTKPTLTRKSPEFADFLQEIAAAYPAADTIHLVMDNLSTHSRKAVVDRFGQKAGDRLWRRFTVHHTPRHGSWLNQAEIEIGLSAANAWASEGSETSQSSPNKRAPGTSASTRITPPSSGRLLGKKQN